MKKLTLFTILGLCFLLLTIGVMGCSSLGSTPKTSIIITSTPDLNKTTTSGDLCSDENKPAEIRKIVRLMRYFDDTSVLAQSTTQQQLAPVLLALGDIMHDAEDVEVPACLETLKTSASNYMRAVFTTMTNFMAGVQGDAITTQINASREMRTAYEAELASQMGLPYYTVTPMATWTATPVTPTSTPAPVTVSTEQDIYVLQGPGETYPAIGTFMIGQSTNAIGRTDDQLWLQIELVDHPGYLGWVPVELVNINGSVGDLAVVPTPAP